LFDNALAQNLWSTIKLKLTYWPATTFATRVEAQAAFFRYIGPPRRWIICQVPQLCVKKAASLAQIPITRGPLVFLLSITSLGSRLGSRAQ
jgi:hypothetical protein